MIVSRYLKRQRSLAREALDRLLAAETPAEQLSEADSVAKDDSAPKRSLHSQRLEVVAATLKATGAKRVLDLGCGEGKLLRLLLAEPQFEFTLGMDVSYRSLERAKEFLRLDEMPERQRTRIDLMQGSLTYRDRRLDGFDAAAIVEVIEHLDTARLATFERIIFEFARPRHVVLTTPNAEYNAIYEKLHAGEFRHDDHRFEWSRKQFQEWAVSLGERFG